jgi:hypothetical protein
MKIIAIIIPAIAPAPIAASLYVILIPFIVANV